MRGKEFLEKLEFIDPAYIEAADSAGHPQEASSIQAVQNKTVQSKTEQNKTKQKRLPSSAILQVYRHPILWGAAAACVCLLLILTLPGILSKQQNQNSIGQPNSSEQNVGQNEANSEQNNNSTSQPNSPEQVARGEVGEADTNKTHSNNQHQNGTEHNLDNSSDGPAPTWDFTYNEADAITSSDATRRYIPGYFTQELGEQELLAIGPGKQIGWMNFSGFAGFDGEGKALEVHLMTTSTLPDTPIQISFSGEPIFSCGLLSEEEAVSSYCNGVDFLVFQYIQKNVPHSTLSLYAEAEINELFYLFQMEAPLEQAEQAKADFEALLECFTVYQAGPEELASLTPVEIPEWFDRTLTWQEARNEADFGAWFLPTVPDSFQEEGIHRFKDQNLNYLSGLWTKGYDSLRWEVHAYDDSDAARLTNIADTQNYDLSLYPIPRAESVPEELREIVDNPVFEAEELTLETVYARAYKPVDHGDSDGWRMNFSVRYGDIVVEVQAKGLSPEWIYKQLMELWDK